MNHQSARIYMRVSTEQQNLERQHQLIESAKKRGLYIAGIYSEKASGVSPNRPELQRLIADLQEGDIVIAESIDRITRLPPREAEKLISSITDKGAKIEVPEIFNIQELTKVFGEGESLPKYLIEPIMNGMQTMFLRMALNMTHHDWKVRQRRQKEGITLAKQRGAYKGRKPNNVLHENIIKLRLNGVSITQVAETLQCSVSTIKRVSKNHKMKIDKS